MTRRIIITGFAHSERFASDLRSSPPEVQRATLEALKHLQANPGAKSLRLHTLSGMPKPTVWKIDVYANHAWQVTFAYKGHPR